jgi:hypothetical protein
MTSIRWSSTHHRDAHCPLSLSPLSSPYHHIDGGNQLSASRLGRHDTVVCRWSHVQSSPWQIWRGTGALLNQWPVLFLWMTSSLPLPFSPLLSSLLLIFSALLAFSSPLPFKPPPSSSSFLLFLTSLLAKLTPVGWIIPWGPCTTDGPSGPPDWPLGLAWQ